MAKQAAKAQPVDRVREVREEVNKKMKETSLLFGSDPVLKLKAIPLGVTPLDDMLGGGLARGRFYLVVGRHAVGKTYFTQLAIKAVQQQGGVAAYIDAERCYNEEWFRKVGIDTDNLLVSQPGTGEKAFDVVLALARARVDLIVVDSLAAMVPTAEAEEGMDKIVVGGQARLINGGCRRLLDANTHSVVLFTNQTRVAIGGQRLGAGETFPGGVGQLFWAWGIVRVTREGWITEKSPKKGQDQQRVGFNMGFRTDKNKQAPPFQSCVIPFYFRTGHLELTAGLVDVAVDLSLIGGKPPHYEFEDQKFFGRARLIAWLDENEKVKTRLWAAVHDALEGTSASGAAADGVDQATSEDS